MPETYKLEAIFIGKAEQSIPKGQTGQVRIWTGDPGKEIPSDESRPAFALTADIHAGKWLMVFRANHHWYVRPMEE